MKRMTRYFFLIVIAVAAGCSSPPMYGFAVVNRTDQDLKDVEVVSGTPGKDFEVYRTKTGDLPARGFMRVLPDNGKLLGESTVSWKQGGVAREQIVNTKVPRGFHGYVCIEFTDDGVHVTQQPLSPPPGN